jgi:hypothetical protein
VHRRDRHVEAFLAGQAAQAQPAAAHRLDMLGPGVDEGDVHAVAGHVPPGVAADGTGADDGNALAHVFSSDRP